MAERWQILVSSSIGLGGGAATGTAKRTAFGSSRPIPKITGACSSGIGRTRRGYVFPVGRVIT